VLPIALATANLLGANPNPGRVRFVHNTSRAFLPSRVPRWPLPLLRLRPCRRPPHPAHHGHSPASRPHVLATLGGQTTTSRLLARFTLLLCL
jgi:hypothetical protein